MIYNNKSNYTRIRLTGRNKENKEIVVIIIKQGGELKMTKSKNVYVERIFPALNGFNAAMKKNVEDQTGIIFNVLELTQRIYKALRTITLTSLVSFVKNNK